jgi:hypothetical protein
MDGSVKLKNYKISTCGTSLQSRALLAGEEKISMGRHFL